MRRKDREVTDRNEIEEILKKAEVCRICLNNGTYPYVIPVNYGYNMKEGKLTLFFHGAKEGMKHAIIEKDPHCSFEVDTNHQLVLPEGNEACQASYCYESVIGQGLIQKVDDAKKEEYLTLLVKQFGIEQTHFNPVALANTVVYIIQVENYTAKKRGI